MTFHTRKCELCERLFSFMANKQDLAHLWRCPSCPAPPEAVKIRKVRQSWQERLTARPMKNSTQHGIGGRSKLGLKVRRYGG